MRSHTRLLACLLVMALSLDPGLVQAQGRGKISGTVVEAGTGQPLPGVNVVIVGTTLGTATDSDGDYFVANLEPGTYDVQASFIGYQTTVVQNVNVRVNATTEVDFELQEAALFGEEILVTATRPLVEKDNTTSVVRLQATEVAARPTTSFTDVLTSLPSINIDNGQMTVRGGTLDQVAFVVDGARARNPMDHSPYTRINLSSIQEVEVITGAFNAEYGEAQSGVINVVTKEGGDRYDFFLDTRYEPPGLKHFGVSLYDTSTDTYWENTHARHLDWWIEYPDQWVDPDGIPGNDPRTSWTPEEAYQNYLDTHQPLTDYTEIPGYQVELGLGGPVPLLNDLYFFGTVKHRSQAPIMGNAFRERGLLTDGTLKLTYRLGGGKRLTASGFYGQDETGWGHQRYPDFFWADVYGIDARYAYNDFVGYPTSVTNGQTLRFAHVLNNSTLYELNVKRIQAKRKQWIFPDDPIGWEASDATRDNLRAVDESGNTIPGGFANRVGHHTTGYYFRFDDDNIEWQTEGYISSQLNKFVDIKAGYDFSYYVLDHFNQSKLPDRRDERVYRPYQGAAFSQSKFEVGGFIMNAGLRFDFYNPNDTVYADLFNPLEGESVPTRLYSQISPRLGISHPIDTRTVLHFSYGHFFQRPSFGDYGEGSAFAQGSLTTFIVDGTNIPWVLGNRNLRPRKTIAFEVGIERNFWDAFVVDLTGYYKDIRNTIRTITIEAPGAIYRTNGNGDYADVRGVEISLRKVPTFYRWGALWGYANYTTQMGITGRSGDPVVIMTDGVRFAPSGDFIQHNNPRFKAGLYYETPSNWKGVLGTLFRNLSVSVDYRANYPNEQLRQDFFLFEGEKHLRPVDRMADLRARKEIRFMNDRVRLSPYVEIQNLFNDKWIYLGMVERASQVDQRRFVESGMKELPAATASGRPILDLAKYRNLPRTFTFGATMSW